MCARPRVVSWEPSRDGNTRVAAAPQGLMLKSSKWAPYQPPQEMLQALQERSDGPDVAGTPPACPAVLVILSTYAVHQEGLLWVRQWPIVSASLPASAFWGHFVLSSAFSTSGNCQCRVGSPGGHVVGAPADSAPS